MSFFSELKRRNVFRVAIAYVIAVWLMWNFPLGEAAQRAFRAKIES